MEYCIKAKIDTDMADITSILNSIKDGFGLRPIGSLGEYNYYSIISISKPLNDTTIERIGKVKGVEKIFLPFED